jgi:hypothetical protein
VVERTAGHVLYLEQDENLENQKLKLFSSYAYGEELSAAREFSLGQGLVGQVAIEKKGFS